VRYHRVPSSAGRLCFTTFLGVLYWCAAERGAETFRCRSVPPRGAFRGIRVTFGRCRQSVCRPNAVATAVAVRTWRGGAWAIVQAGMVCGQRTAVPVRYTFTATTSFSFFTCGFLRVAFLPYPTTFPQPVSPAAGIQGKALFVPTAAQRRSTVLCAGWTRLWVRTRKRLGAPTLLPRSAAPSYAPYASVPAIHLVCRAGSALPAFSGVPRAVTCYCTAPSRTAWDTYLVYITPFCHIYVVPVWCFIVNGWFPPPTPTYPWVSLRGSLVGISRTVWLTPLRTGRAATVAARLGSLSGALCAAYGRPPGFVRRSSATSCSDCCCAAWRLVSISFGLLWLCCAGRVAFIACYVLPHYLYLALLPPADMLLGFLDGCCLRLGRLLPFPSGVWFGLLLLWVLLMCHRCLGILPTLPAATVHGSLDHCSSPPVLVGLYY